MIFLQIFFNERGDHTQRVGDERIKKSAKKRSKIEFKDLRDTFMYIYFSLQENFNKRESRLPKLFRGLYMKSIIAILTLLFCFLIPQIDAQETGRKIYVSADQIELTKDGIFAYVAGLEKPIAGKILSFDEHGMYILEWKGPCWIHDLWCNRCGGCGVLLCPMNCSCYD